MWGCGWRHMYVYGRGFWGDRWGRFWLWILREEVGSYLTFVEVPKAVCEVMAGEIVGRLGQVRGGGSSIFAAGFTSSGDFEGLQGGEEA